MFLKVTSWARTDFKIDKAMIVTNTRYSEHAIKYGLVQRHIAVGWNYPSNQGLEDMIEEKRIASAELP